MADRRSDDHGEWMDDDDDNNNGTDDFNGDNFDDDDDDDDDDDADDGSPLPTAAAAATATGTAITIISSSTITTTTATTTMRCPAPLLPGSHFPLAIRGRGLGCGMLVSGRSWGCSLPRRVDPRPPRPSHRRASFWACCSGYGM